MENFKILTKDIDKEWAIKELQEFLKYIRSFMVDKTYSITHKKAYRDWHEYINNKLNEYSFIGGKPEENTPEKNPKAAFWWCIYTIDIYYYRPFHDHHCSAKKLKDQMLNIINDATTIISKIK